MPTTPILWRLHIPAPPDQVYAALSTDSGRAAFWAESAVETDGVIDFRFINGYRHRARILERTPPRVFAVDYIDGPARFTLQPDGRGGTDLLLTQEGVKPENHAEVHAGWLNVLFPLKAWVAHGIDLRNHDPSRTWDQGYADQ